MWFESHSSNSTIQIKSNQIKWLLLSHHHSTSALVSEILMSVLQTVQKNNRQFTYGQTVQKTTAIYIWTVHIYRLYRRQCAKYTYIYSVRLVYYRDILNYQRHIIHLPDTQFLPEPRFLPTNSGYKSNALSIWQRLPSGVVWRKTVTPLGLNLLSHHV